MTLPSVTFIIPTYNDEATIHSVIQHVLSMAKTVARSYSLLVLDDASTDSTPQILQNLTKQTKAMRVITHSKNQGYGKSIKELYLKADKEWLFSLPGDFQINPSELMKLIPYAQSHDIVLGKRINRSDNIFRLIQSKIYNALLRLLFRLTLSDVNTVRLMRTSIFNTISLVTDSAFVDAEMLIHAKRQGLRVIEIPIEHSKRISGKGTGGNIRKTILPTVKDLILFRVFF